MLCSWVWKFSMRDLFMPVSVAATIEDISVFISLIFLLYSLLFCSTSRCSFILSLRSSWSSYSICWRRPASSRVWAWLVRCSPRIRFSSSVAAACYRCSSSSSSRIFRVVISISDFTLNSIPDVRMNSSCRISLSCNPGSREVRAVVRGGGSSQRSLLPFSNVVDA